MIDNDVLQHVHVERNVKCTRTHRRHLTQQDIFGNTSAVINITNGSGFQQDFDSLFERTSRQSARIRSVDTVSCDRHELSLVAHEITQQGQMSVIDI
jgi:hypothetical protein